MVRSKNIFMFFLCNASIHQFWGNSEKKKMLPRVLHSYSCAWFSVKPKGIVIFFVKMSLFWKRRKPCWNFFSVAKWVLNRFLRFKHLFYIIFISQSVVPLIDNGTKVLSTALNLTILWLTIELWKIIMSCYLLFLISIFTAIQWKITCQTLITIKFYRLTFPSLGRLIVPAVTSMKSLRWLNTKSHKSPSLHKDVGVTIANSKVSEVSQSPSWGRR